MTKGIEDLIYTLFGYLPSERQAVVLDELHNRLLNDDIDEAEVEIIDEEIIDSDDIPF